jgi:iron complex outermembrane recepter protein
MRRMTSLLCSTTAVTAMLAAASPAMAQTTGQPPQTTPQENPAESTGSPAAQAGTPAAPQAGADQNTAIVVTGLRRSLQSARNIKRVARQQIDAIVAEDIGKLPDINTAETAARIPGVQVNRRGGEADTVLVRGLPDFATTYNGREIFTAETRVVALQDFPSANIAALEVFKTTTANLAEAGLAGLVNVRSRRPFDFTGFFVGGSAYAVHTRQAGKTRPNGDILISDRWHVGGGEMGILLNASQSDLTYLDSENSNTDFIQTFTVDASGNFVAPDAPGAREIRLPDVQRIFYRTGNRKRPSVNGAFQWRPNPDLEFYVDGLYQGFRNKISDRLLAVPLWGGDRFANLQFRDDTNLVQSGTSVNPFRPDGFQGATFNKTDTYQFAAGGSWNHGPLHLQGDLARSRSTFKGSTESVDYAFANRQTVNFNSGTPNGGGGGPEFSFENFDPADPANYIFRGLFEEAQVSKGNDWQARLDGQYDTGITWLPRIEAGLRYVDHKAHREFGSRYANFESRRIPISAITPLDYELFRGGFRGSDLQDGIRSWLAPTYSSVRDDLPGLRQFIIDLGAPDVPPSFGVFTTDPVAPDPLQTYNAREKTTAAYAQANYVLGAIDGVIGMRAEKTDDRIVGTSSVAPVGGVGPTVFTPVNVGNKYWNWLPNASVRWHISSQAQLRLSATKTRTRPTFAQLNPSATLGPPPTVCPPTGGDPFACARSGNGGNPFLKPFKSKNYDASLEYYFSPTGFAAAAVFRRDLSGFIQNGQIRYIDPNLGPLIINGPVNTNKGRINGVEAQASSFFDWGFVPSFLRHFGAQANMTYLDARVQDPDPVIGNRRIYGVSKWTWNLVGMYEANGLSARLSYNKQTSFLGDPDLREPPGIQNRGDDIYIQHGHPAGRLDLSTSYDVMKHLSLFFDWTNITQKPNRYDFSSARAGRPRAEYTRYFRFTETTLSGGVRVRFGK